MNSGCAQRPSWKPTALAVSFSGTHPSARAVVTLIEDSVPRQRRLSDVIEDSVPRQRRLSDLWMEHR
jgi:hypothetical protein